MGINCSNCSWNNQQDLINEIVNENEYTTDKIIRPKLLNNYYTKKHEVK